MTGHASDLRNALDALDLTDAVRSRHVVAGRVVEIVALGDGTPALTRAFDPLLADDGGPADLVVYAVVTDALPIVRPDNEGPVDRWLVRAQDSISLLTEDQIHYLGDDDVAVWWASGTMADHPWEASRPFYILFDWWFEKQGLHLVHAGAVASDRGAALIVGPGGSGKSTTCLVAIGTELGYLSDDYCLIEMGEDPVVSLIYATGKADQNSLDLLEPRGVQGDEIRPDGKATIFLNERWPQALCRSAEIKAVIVPEVTAASSQAAYRRVSAMVALRALAPSSLLQLRGVEGTKFSDLASLAASVPCYAMTVGSDLDSIPSAIEAILDS